jgi:predicted metal-dependent phosphoesterase TrpH
MRRPRRIAALLVGAGILTSTVSDVDVRQAPPVDSGFHVLAADFHVHAAIGDGGLAPWDARREAARRGLDVIAIANHNQMLSVRLHRWLFRDTGSPLVLSGQEVTAPSHHIVAVGVSSPVDWNQSAADTIREIHSRGGVAIAAHPHRETAEGYDAEALALLDAAERAHPGMHRDDEIASGYAEFFALARQHNPRLSPVGDSDFHFTGRIGLCHTYVLAREITEAAVLDALRSGRTVAYDVFDRPYGEPALIEIAERARHARTRRAAAPAWAAWANGAGVLMAWTGLVLLVLMGPTQPRLTRGSASRQE